MGETQAEFANIAFCEMILFPQRASRRVIRDQEEAWAATKTSRAASSGSLMQRALAADQNHLVANLDVDVNMSRESGRVMPRG
jgi:hypothetical protein